MGDVNITVSHSRIDNGSTVVGNIQMGSPQIDFDRIVKELQEIKASLKQGSHEYEIVASLEEDSKKKNWGGISSTITKYMPSFASGALANFAGVYLSKLFQLG